MPGIDRLDEHRLDAATLTLTRAFHTDPMFEWIFPDPAERSRALGHLLRVPLRYGLRRGHVTQSDAAKAVAIWMPPGRSVTPGGMIRAIHKRRVSEPHWYLMIVGVDTELQGQGRGAALVKEGLDRADREALPCYLETSEERNLRFYERLGFKVVESARLGAGGPEAWAMLRETPNP
jgi:GNAT superfamily N-acetyltransferase